MKAEIILKGKDGEYRSYTMDFNDKAHADNWCRKVEKSGSKVVGISYPEESKVEYFLMGGYISALYDMQGVDKVLDAMHKGSDWTLCEFDPTRDTGASLLNAFQGHDGFITISKEDYTKLKNGYGKQEDR